MAGNIVVPLDGSALAEKALPLAAALATRSGEKLVLLRLVAETAEIEAELKSARAYVEEVHREITHPDLDNRLEPNRVEVQVVPGNPEDLGPIISKLDATLVVMTTHGRTGLSRLIMGSVAKQTLAHLNVPVILIRPADIVDSQLPMELMYRSSELPGPEHSYAAQMVVTLDGTPEAETVLQPAAALARALRFTLCLVRVVTPHHPITEGVNFASVPDLEQRHYEAAQYLKGLQHSLTEQDVNCTSQVLTGEPDREIVDYAGQRGVVMLAMASHTRGKLGRLVLGSVAEKVMSATHLPVMMVHPAAS